MTFEFATNKIIPYKVKERRIGDVAMCYADVRKAKQKLNWETKRSLFEMCSSAWKFEKFNQQNFS